MTPGEFLCAVWPSEGVYCLATPFIIPGSTPPQRVYAHKTFDDISDAVSFVLNQKGRSDLFFAVHTLKEKQVWNPEKVNRKTGEMGSNEVRTQRNAKASRAFFFDLDVGQEPHKYDSQTEAVKDLIRFCSVTKLPKPLVVTSGGGLHVYWIISEALDSEVWRVEATKLKQLARHHGLKVDPMRTTDTASVLRVAGTFNFKDRSHPRDVVAMTPANETGVGLFVSMLDKALIEAGVEPAQPVQPKLNDAADFLGSNTKREYDGPPVTLKALLLSCAQMRRLALAKGMMTEPEWYHGVIGVGRFLEDGHRRVQQMSEGYPGYNADATAEKIRQHEARRDSSTGAALGPTSCAKLAEVSTAGDGPCSSCPFAGKVHGPIGAARYKDPAPAPQLQELLGTTPVSTTLPDPPKPFVRLKGGGIAIHGKDSQGNETYSTIYEHDLYPVRRLSNPQAGIEQHVWHVDLPRNESKDFTLDADMLYDPRKFVTAISHQGIYPHKSHIPLVQEYMVAYISQLQKLVDADAQANHLGWLDDYSRFVLPDKVLSADGTVKSAQLSLGAQRASIEVYRKGDLAKQVELLKFHNHPEYVAHQFYILSGLAAPIFFATGHHGVIVNVSGPAGASKSTSLYAAASFWGHPSLLPINGTNSGATVRGRNERIAVLANLPVCVDEITHMPVNEAIDLAMSITQPGHRIRLQTDGVERANLGSYKATIMMTTANNSLHGLLSTNNAAGTAGSMRVVEIDLQPPRVHKKREADAFLHDLKENFGHLGELFIAYVIAKLPDVIARVRAVVVEIDEALGISAAERFWSATIASIIVAGEIANEMGILTYDMVAIRKWINETLVPQMRGVVRQEYSDPLAVLSDYLEQINNNIVVVAKSQSNVGQAYYVERNPSGALYGHYDREAKVLYVLKKAFKDHCARIGANSLKVVEDLHQLRDGARIISDRNTRRTLGAGTQYAKAQSWCFAINMEHPEVSGVTKLTVISGSGEGGSVAKPDLKVV